MGPEEFSLDDPDVQTNGLKKEHEQQNELSGQSSHSMLVSKPHDELMLRVCAYVPMRDKDMDGRSMQM